MTTIRAGTVRERQLRAQYNYVHSEGGTSFSAQLIEENLNAWILTLQGPKDSPYEIGTFKFNITFPPEFPFRWPNLVCLTKIYHPNIESSSGTVAWSLFGEDWTPAASVANIMRMLEHMLMEPMWQVECGIVLEIGWEVKERPENYRRKAAEWTKKYAMGRRGEGSQVE